jgi:hypothetical protein
VVSRRHQLSAYAHEAEHFAALTGESALHAAVQGPVDGFAQAAPTGAVYGSVFMPVNDHAHFWRARSINGVGWAVGAGVAGSVAEGIHILNGVAAPAVEEEAAKSAALTLRSRSVEAVLRGVSSGLAKTETFALSDKRLFPFSLSLDV